MIKKLRRKFIAVSMCSLLLVLGLIMLGVNIVNYRSTVRDADETLSYLAANDGAFPKNNGHKGGGMGGLAGNMSPELPFESRYFSVLLDADGGLISADTGKIAAVDTDTAVKFAGEVFASGDKSGFKGSYRFTAVASEAGTRIIFLDCGRSLGTFRSFLLASCGISLTGLLAVFVLIAVFSGRIIRPVSESYEKQKRFITDAGHEIKTPLTIISADADVLEMDSGSNEWLDDIQKQTKRLTELTNDLIYLSRMEEEQNRLQMVDFPVSDVVEETAQSFCARARTGGKALEISVQPLLSLTGDEKAIRQLTSILLDNALKYSPEGGSISLRLEKEQRAISLSVRNTTEQGFDAGSTAKLFERFYRGDESHSSQSGGYGIGLSIAKAVVNAHRGRISASAQDGRTLTVTALFPI